MISAAWLRRLFGWSASSFRAAADSGKLPFRTHRIPGRRGLFAQTVDVDRALAERTAWSDESLSSTRDVAQAPGLHRGRK